MCIIDAMYRKNLLMFSFLVPKDDIKFLKFQTCPVGMFIKYQKERA